MTPFATEGARLRAPMIRESWHSNDWKSLTVSDEKKGYDNEESGEDEEPE
jgi:hypothetical protein